MNALYLKWKSILICQLKNIRDINKYKKNLTKFKVKRLKRKGQKCVVKGIEFKINIFLIMYKLILIQEMCTEENLLLAGTSLEF